MAEPIEFSGANRNYIPAPGNEDTVRSMSGYTDGVEIIGCWKLSDLERHTVAETGEIWVSIACGSKPPPYFVSGLPLMSLHDGDGVKIAGYRSDGNHQTGAEVPASETEESVNG